MSMTIVQHRTDRLESRMDRIERELNLPLIDHAPGEGPLSLAPADDAAPLQSEPVQSEAVAHAIAEPAQPTPPVAPAPSAGPQPPPIAKFAPALKPEPRLPEARDPDARDPEPRDPEPPAELTAQPPPLLLRASILAPVLPYARATTSPPQQGALEQTIGLKWAGWIGALVLVIGAGLGIKYAYEQGYFDILPPAARLMLMSLGGFGLIAAGEWVFRRVNKLAAAAVYASGVATLFFVSHAGSAYYGLYEPTTAFVMMAMTTLVGAAVAMRGRLVSIAVLSLIGGNLAPFVLGREDLHVTPFLGYLLMLQVVSITLAWWGRDAFWRMLRGLSLASTALWMAPLLLRGDGSDWPVLVAFAVVYAVLYQVEVIASAIRRGMSDRAAGVSDDVGFSLAVTAALTTGLLLLFRDASALWQGSCIAALSVACGFAGAVLGLIRREVTRPLSIGFLVQSAALAVLAVPVAFSGATVIIGWSILALMFAGAGAALDLRSLRAAAAGTWRRWRWGSLSTRSARSDSRPSRHHCCRRGCWPASVTLSRG